MVEAIGPADVVIVATKATQNAAVLEYVRAAVRPDSVLLIAPERGSITSIGSTSSAASFLPS